MGLERTRLHAPGQEATREARTSAATLRQPRAPTTTTGKVVIPHLPPLRKTPRISSRMTSSPLSKPSSEGGDGNTGSGAMAEEATREEKISPPTYTQPRPRSKEAAAKGSIWKTPPKPPEDCLNKPVRSASRSIRKTPGTPSAARVHERHLAAVDGMRLQEGSWDNRRCLGI